MCQGLNSHCFPMVGMVINLQDRLSHHPRYGDPELQRPALKGTVFFAGTETARRHGGAVVENGPHWSWDYVKLVTVGVLLRRSIFLKEQI